MNLIRTGGNVRGRCEGEGMEGWRRRGISTLEMKRARGKEIREQ